MQNWNTITVLPRSYSKVYTACFTPSFNHCGGGTIAGQAGCSLHSLCWEWNSTHKITRVWWCRAVIVMKLEVSLWIYTYQIEYPTNISSYMAYPVNNIYILYSLLRNCFVRILSSRVAWISSGVRGQVGCLLCYLCHMRRRGSLVSTVLLSQQCSAKLFVLFRLQQCHIHSINPPQSPLVQTMVTQYYNSLWRWDTICWWCERAWLYTELWLGGGIILVMNSQLWVSICHHAWMCDDWMSSN